MDYKSVIEEQIRELQKVQDFNVENKISDMACRIATTIKELVLVANSY